ncbi:hypothetical protein DCAR_0831344 [Daucus carota subsp. sativus]|uniref:Uncharacterized protein n=1 Tax=Daucus carota subsp. sativus TaxID=79200 RepID=A0AAF0XPK1_DAUCS|nr:hypothetical protein DCAR_0831344 [Daucus carota subsp. sativus]
MVCSTWQYSNNCYYFKHMYHFSVLIFIKMWSKFLVIIYFPELPSIDILARLM